MKQSIWRINDKSGNEIGLLETESFLDIIDVCQRAKNRYGENVNWQSPVYVGETNSTNTTKFYNFSQNNSGGYFVNNDENGVCEELIIEAESALAAWDKLESIGEMVDGFWSFCNCCGERWSFYLDEEDGTDEPTLDDIPVENAKGGIFKNRCFVHYANNTFKEFKLK